MIAYILNGDMNSYKTGCHNELYMILIVRLFIYMVSYKIIFVECV